MPCKIFMANIGSDIGFQWLSRVQTETTSRDGKLCLLHHKLSLFVSLLNLYDMQGLSILLEDINIIIEHEICMLGLILTFETCTQTCVCYCNSFIAPYIGAISHINACTFLTDSCIHIKHQSMYCAIWNLIEKFSIKFDFQRIIIAFKRNHSVKHNDGTGVNTKYLMQMNSLSSSVIKIYLFSTHIISAN